MNTARTVTRFVQPGYSDGYPAAAQERAAAEPILVLRANLAKLNARDQEFARSLLAARTLSTKQHHWIGVLAERATTPAPEPATTQIGDIAAIVALIDRAKSKLKWPAILLQAGDKTIRVTVAGPAAREPGSITVTSADRDASGQRIWLGRITKAGVFEARRGTPPTVAAALVSFAHAPAKVAAEYGHRTGFCCFCAKPLDDERSTAVGYGPVCAKNWDLAWGVKPARLVCEGEG